jgi:hypothetical protein
VACPHFSGVRITSRVSWSTADAMDPPPCPFTVHCVQLMCRAGAGHASRVRVLASARPTCVHQVAEQHVQGSPRVVLVFIACAVIYFNTIPSQRRPLLPELCLPLVTVVVRGAPVPHCLAVLPPRVQTVWRPSLLLPRHRQAVAGPAGRAVAGLRWAAAGTQG